MSGRHPDQVVDVPLSIQDWSHLTFLHWRYDPATLQRLMPAGLAVQVIDGSAWVGATPFQMSNVRVPGLPPVPRWSTFPEVNVRTYVEGPDGRDGLWFFSLDCPRRAVVLGLRAVGVPYVLSRADLELRQVDHAGAPPPSSTGRRTDVGEGPLLHYEFTRRAWPGARHAAFDALVRVGSELAPQERSPLIESLTGRWGAYVRRLRRLWRVPVDHEVWPLHRARAGGDLTQLLRAAGLPEPDGDPVVHFSPGVQARIGPPAPA